jgi:hypothetical protein
MRRKRKPKIRLGKRGLVRPRRGLYWAYGSNLSHAQMRSRCPGAVPVGPLSLAGGVLTFRGYADVESREGGVIAGGLWRISRKDELVLDACEGVGRHGHYEKRYLLLEVDGVQEKCLYYRMANPEGVLPPWDDYLAKITQGYRDFRLDPQLLDEALARAWGEKEKTDHVMRRWKSRGKPRLAKPETIQ